MRSGAGASPPRTAPIYYGWVILGLSFFTLAFHITSRFSFGIFQVPLIEEFGWSRGALGGVFALSLGIYALGAPYAGSLLERKGPRAVMPWGSIFVGAAMAGGFFISSLWHLYLLSGVVGGIGLALSGFAMHSAIIPRWFVRKRGFATGLALSGIGIGILVLSPTIERTIALWGWRVAYLAMGLTILLVIGPANFLLLHNRPEDVGQGPDGGPPRGRPNDLRSSLGTSPRGHPEASAAEANPHAGKGVREVFHTVKRDGRFWALVLLVFAIGLNNNIIMSQLQLYLVDARYTTAAAALIFGAVGFIRTGGSVAGGWLGDRIGRGRGVAISAGAVAMGLTLLLFVPALGGGALAGYLFALIYGMGIGGMSSCYSALAGDCFEGPTYGVIIGFMEICYGLGGVLGPPFAGLMFDYTGSYLVPFSLIIIFMIGTIFLALWLHKNAARLARAAAG